MREGSGVPLPPQSTQLAAEGPVDPVIEFCAEKRLHHLFIEPDGPALGLPTGIVVVDGVGMDRNVAAGAGVGHRAEILHREDFQLRGGLAGAVGPDAEPFEDGQVPFRAGGQVTASVRQEEGQAVVIVQQSFHHGAVGFGPEAEAGSDLVVVLEAKKGRVMQ